MKSGWKRTKKGKKVFYTTNHGTKVELDRKDLENKIKETRQSLEGLQDILELMNDYDS